MLSLDQPSSHPPPARHSTGEKLNYEQASALLFTLNVVLGNYLNPLTPPDAALEATNNTSTA